MIPPPAPQPGWGSGAICLRSRSQARTAMGTVGVEPTRAFDQRCLRRPRSEPGCQWLCGLWVFPQHLHHTMRHMLLSRRRPTGRRPPLPSKREMRSDFSGACAAPRLSSSGALLNSCAAPGLQGGGRPKIMARSPPRSALAAVCRSSCEPRPACSGAVPAPKSSEASADATPCLDARHEAGRLARRDWH
jgi:hypothetical protein